MSLSHDQFNQQTKILLCAPKHFEVIYEINPWMNKKIQPQAKVANEQWQNLNKALKESGASIEFVDGVKGLPDMVYTANGGLISGNIAIVSKFRYPERQGEEPHFEKWFLDHGFTVKHLKSGFFEGEGDALFGGDTLCYGYGFRSDLKVADEVQKIVEAPELVPCELINPYYYHLDTALCPLSKDLAFFYPAAFTKDSIKRLEKNFELFAVPEDDAKKFVCNAVPIGRNVVLPAQCVQTEKWLVSKGYAPKGVQLDQFLRGGGSAKCLTLFL